MHKRGLTEEEIDIAGEHSVRKVEFDQLNQKQGQVTVVRGDEVTDWIVIGLTVDDWEGLCAVLKSGEASIDAVEHMLETNGFQLSDE